VSAGKAPLAPETMTSPDGFNRPKTPSGRDERGTAQAQP